MSQRPALTPQDLEDLYTDLCYRMSEAGEAATPEILARLALLLMNEVGNATRIRGAIDAALADFPRVLTIERPV